MEIFGLDDWLAWFLLAIGLLIVEALIAFTFYAAPIALGAFTAAVVAAFGDAIEPQLVAFILGAGLGIGIVRPLIRRHLVPASADSRSNVDLLIGSRAIALEPVDIDSGTARIGGEVWSARTLAEEIVIADGERAEVASIRGAYAYLKPIETAPAADPPEGGRGEDEADADGDAREDESR